MRFLGSTEILNEGMKTVHIREIQWKVELHMDKAADGGREELLGAL